MTTHDDEINQGIKNVQRAADRIRVFGHLNSIAPVPMLFMGVEVDTTWPKDKLVKLAQVAYEMGRQKGMCG